MLSFVAGDDEIDESELLLSVNQHSHDVDVGATCVVANSNQSAVLYTGKPVFWCCIMWGFESIPLADGTVVEVMDVDTNNPVIVTVRVLRCPTNRDTEDLIGTMKSWWLTRAREEEARLDALTFPAKRQARQPQAPQPQPEQAPTPTPTPPSTPPPPTFTENIKSVLATPPIAGKTEPSAPSPPPPLDLDSITQQVEIRVPYGNLHIHHLKPVMPLFKEGLVEYSHIFPCFCDKHTRTLRGNIIREIAKMIKSSRFHKLAFLTPLRSALVQVRTNGEEDLVWDFDFKGASSHNVTAPAQEKWVVNSSHPDDPYLVDPRNIVECITTEPRTFIVKKRVRFRVSPRGIQSVGESDIRYRQNMFLSLDVKVRTFHGITRVETDEKKRPFLKSDRQGRPIIHNGRYVPHVYDDWMVITIFGKERWIGLPALSHDELID